MERLLELKIKDKKPYIILKRELETTDFKVVNGDETQPNSIRFMFEDEDDWQRLEPIESQPNELYSVLKIRFLYAVELEELMREKVKSGELQMHPAYWSEYSVVNRIYKRQVHAPSEAELEAEQDKHQLPLYEAAVKYINKSINDFNMISMGANNG